jgi:hypothetical protein
MRDDFWEMSIRAASIPGTDAEPLKLYAIALRHMDNRQVKACYMSDREFAREFARDAIKKAQSSPFTTNLRYVKDAQVSLAEMKRRRMKV